jgi:hypothetical protein
MWSFDAIVRPARYSGTVNASLKDGEPFILFGHQ